MRIAFMGSPDFAVPALRALYQAWAHYCSGLLPAGPTRRSRPSRPPLPSSGHADELGLPVRTPSPPARRRRSAGRVLPRSIWTLPLSLPTA